MKNWWMEKEESSWKNILLELHLCVWNLNKVILLNIISYDLLFFKDKEDIIDRYRSIGCFDKLLSKTELKPAFMNYKGQLLSLEQAPDPTDVNWVNLQYSSSEKFKRRL